MILTETCFRSIRLTESHLLSLHFPKPNNVKIYRFLSGKAETAKRCLQSAMARPFCDVSKLLCRVLVGPDVSDQVGHVLRGKSILETFGHQ